MIFLFVYPLLVMIIGCVCKGGFGGGGKERKEKVSESSELICFQFGSFLFFLFFFLSSASMPTTSFDERVWTISYTRVQSIPTKPEQVRCLRDF